jgi:tetratricopeptide (TPR) repeat protein
MLRGHARWAQNDIEAALADFTLAAQSEPSNCFTHFNRASALGKLNALKKAFRPPRMQSSSTQSFRPRASLYQDGGQNGNALKDYIEVFHLEDSADALHLIGRICQKQGQIPEALSRFAADFRPNANSSTPQIVRARLYLALNDYAAALKDLNEVIRANPRLSYAYELRADTQNGNSEELAYERDLRKVIELNPRNHSALNNLAYALVSKPDRLSESRNLIIQATRYAPENADYLDTRGWNISSATRATPNCICAKLPWRVGVM